MPNDNRQGTGRHPHKDSKEPWPHTQGNRQQSQQQGSGRGQQGAERGGRKQQQQQQGGGAQSEQQSLKSREYRDENGQIHHHTRSYMEQHGRGGGKDR
jgi:hypothetical protein